MLRRFVLFTLKVRPKLLTYMHWDWGSFFSRYFVLFSVVGASCREGTAQSHVKKSCVVFRHRQLVQRTCFTGILNSPPGEFLSSDAPETCEWCLLKKIHTRVLNLRHFKRTSHLVPTANAVLVSSSFGCMETDVFSRLLSTALITAMQMRVWWPWFSRSSFKSEKYHLSLIYMYLLVR